MSKNTFGGLKAIGGGKSISSANKPTTKQKSSHGKIMGAGKAPLPKQKKAKGSGIAGRGTGV